MTPDSRPRVGAVSYLNTCPLIWGFLHGQQQGIFDLLFQLPAECSQSLENGNTSIGLLPVVEVFRQNLDVVSNVGIASDGPARSIFLLHRKPLSQVRSIAVDTSSRTSVALAKILLAEIYSVQPEEFPSAPDAQAMLLSADCALLIGDPALRLNLRFRDFEVVDLGAEWKAHTGLPMVYAVWAGRPKSVSRISPHLFQDSLDYGLERIEEIIDSEAGKRSISPGLARTYLTDHIRYRLTGEYQKGLAEFRRLCGAHNLI